MRPLFFTTLGNPNWVQSEVQLSQVQIKITNKDTFEWVNKSVRLNEDSPEAYQCDIARLTAGATATISLVTFSDNAGKHFEPWRERVTEIWIGGSGHEFRQFANCRACTH